MELQPPQLENWDIMVGEVSTVWGLAGEVKVAVHTDFPDRFVPGTEFCCVKRDGGRSLIRIASSRPHQGAMLVRVEGCESPEDAEAFRGSVFCITREMRRPLPEGRFYISDLIGIKVVTTEGTVIGNVTEVLKTGGNDVYVTEKGLIPSIREVVQDVDLVNRQMTIRLMDGLFE